MQLASVQPLRQSELTTSHLGMRQAWAEAPPLLGRAIPSCMPIGISDTLTASAHESRSPMRQESPSFWLPILFGKWRRSTALRLTFSLRLANVWIGRRVITLLWSFAQGMPFSVQASSSRSGSAQTLAAADAQSASQSDDAASPTQCDHLHCRATLFGSCSVDVGCICGGCRQYLTLTTSCIRLLQSMGYSLPDPVAADAEMAVADARLADDNASGPLTT